MASDGFVKWLDGPTYAAVDERRLASVQQMPGGPAFASRSGLRAGTGDIVSVGGSPEAWTVQPHAGRVFDSNYATEGAFDYTIPATVTGTLPARPADGTSRRDLVVASIDPTVGEVHLAHVAGVAGSSPTGPDVPERSTVLATLLVPASGSISTVPSTQVAVAAGGVLPVATTVERDNLTGYRGLVVHNAQTGVLEVHDGSGWTSVVETDPLPAGLWYRDVNTSWAKDGWRDVTAGMVEQYTVGNITKTTGSVTINEPGVYMLSGALAPDGAGNHVIRLAVNTQTHLRGIADSTDGNTISTSARLSVGDTVNLDFWPRGSNTGNKAGLEYTQLSVVCTQRV